MEPEYHNDHADGEDIWRWGLSDNTSASHVVMHDTATSHPFDSALAEEKIESLALEFREAMDELRSCYLLLVRLLFTPHEFTAGTSAFLD